VKSAWLRRLFFSPTLLVWVCPFIMLSPVLFTGKAIYWGTPLLQFIPWWTQAWHTLQIGELPLWNPLLGMGAPLLANYQSALLYPPTWIYFGLAALGGVPAMALGMGWLVALNLAWAGWGMVRLTRTLGWPEGSQAVSGLAFGLSGYLVARSHFLSINAAVAWLPWIMLAVYQLVKEPRDKGTLIKLTLFVGMQLLAGHAQTTWYSLLLAFIWLVYWSWQEGRWQRVWQAGRRFLLAGGWAAALTAPQLLPTAEYLLQSQRAAEFTAEYGMTYSFWPWHFLNLLSPFIFGSPAHGDYWGYGAYWEDAIYFGLLGLMLAIAALIRRGKTNSEKKLVWFLTIIIMVSSLFGLGSNTPIFPWISGHIPTFDMFQAPARFLIWAQFGLALLAGMGVLGWHRPLKRALYWSRLGTMGAFAITVGAGAGWWSLRSGVIDLGNIKTTFISAFALLGLWGLGVGVLNLLAPQDESPQPKRWWLWAVSLWLAADLLVAGWGLNPGTNRQDYREMAGIHASELVQKSRFHISLADEQTLKFNRFFFFDTFEIPEGVMAVRDNLLPDTNILDDVSVTSNFDPILPARFVHLMEMVDEQPLETRDDVLCRMGVDKVIEVDDSEPFKTYERPLPVNYGHIRWAGCALSVPDEEKALEALLSGHMINNMVVVEGLETVQCDQASPVSYLELNSPNSVLLGIDAEKDGYLVLTDTWYPGWLATVDDQQVDILHADYLFRAVFVPAGVHKVEFIYRPLSFYGGAAIGALGWLVMAWVLWRIYLDRR
jgi:hypothetical protein